MNFFKKNVYKVLILLLVICISLWGYKLYSKHKEQQYRASYAVVQQIPVFLPKKQSITVIHNYIGRVEAINDTQIVPYISGYITGINAVGGQKVKQGEVMAVLQQDQYLAALAFASAELFSAKAAYLNAKIKYRRTKNAGSAAVSKTELDNAKTAFIQAKGALDQAEANKLAAQINYNYTYLTAPFDGVIGNVFASPGDFISPQNKPLARLIQFSPIHVVFAVSDKEYLTNTINAKNEELKVQLADGRILPQKGIVKYTSNVIDKSTNSIAVYAEFENNEQQLVPEAYVNIIQEKKFENIILIPKNLLQLKPNGSYIYTVLGNVLQLHKIEMLAEYENKAVIKDNFKPREYVVASVIEETLLGKKVEINEISEE